jgi:hypothetical protein
VSCESDTASPVSSLPHSSPSNIALPAAAGSTVDRARRRRIAGPSVAGVASAANPAEKRRACRRTGVMMKSETSWAIAKHRVRLAVDSRAVG